MKRNLAIAGFMAIALMFTGVNGAKAQTQTGLLLLQVDGEDFSDAEKAKVTAQVKENLKKYKKYKVIEDLELDLLDAMVDFECLDVDAECLAAIGGKYQADQVLYISLQSGKAILLLVDVKSKTDLKRDDRAGDAASMARALPDVGLQAVLGAFPKPVLVKPKDVRIVYSFKSNIKGALIFINKRKIGATPLSVKLKPGRYSVELKHDGYLPVAEKILVSASGDKVWNPVLKPAPTKTPVVAKVPTKEPEKKPKVEDDDGTPFYATWWFWTSVGVGVAAATTTAVILATGGDSDVGVGTTKFTLEPSSAQYDAIFYR
jgi:PEGA domain